MDHFRRQQQHRLRELSKNSSTTIQALDSKISLAERILKLAELCRRLETDQEKVTAPCHQPSHTCTHPYKLTLCSGHAAG